MRTSPVRHVLSQDVPELAQTLSSAFFEDPVMMWVFDDPGSRPEKLRQMMRFSLEAGLGRGHAYTTENRRAAALWSPPETPFFDPQGGRAFGALMHELSGSGGDAKLESLSQLFGHHPADPHFYLYVLGTHASHQSQGLGGQVIRPVLDICDADRLGAYLESSNPRNLPFYKRNGFEVRDELDLRDGPTTYLMWRDPR